ncbi:MAG: DNA topoisomerase 4 subunit A [Deltaproteobacteria bacterium]|nr:DNA topoisomerase 4 subunit A [Deltaproteobacteria bacterium]
MGAHVWSIDKNRPQKTPLHEEVEKRYLTYALSTIVSRALPDVRDGLKPVHRRILYAMQAMGLSDAARMRKSAAVVGEVIGKYHPHGDQAAYDALVRMAQDFSLRYPLVDGLGNFGSVDGDAPAAMRYTETRLSAFADLLLREIELGTTDFHATYDAMGKEPDVLPAALPNLLLNGSSGIAVGMSCSFPPHNLREVVAACRAAIYNRDARTADLLRYIQGPDFPTGGEILDQPGLLTQIYSEGHGSIALRGTYTGESPKKGRRNLVITSIPYSVNKARLVERIALLIREKKLKHVQDVRDESAEDVRVVLELRSADVDPEAVMAFVYKHTDLQINFPVNFIAVTAQGIPERLSLAGIIRRFLDFRYETTVRRLRHRMSILQERIHLLEGFAALFTDPDKALEIIRSARNRAEAAARLKETFRLDDEQVNAILEMRLYRLVEMEKDKLLEELAGKRNEAETIARDLADSKRLWKLVDKELADIEKRFGDDRRTRIVKHTDAVATDYNPDDFVEHEDVTVIVSQQGWLRRVKMEVDDPAAMKFREGDGLFAMARVRTDRTIAFFSNMGKVYVIRALDAPATSGFGEPLGSLFTMVDGERMVGFIAPDPVEEPATQPGAPVAAEDQPGHERLEYEIAQGDLFSPMERESSSVRQEGEEQAPATGLLVTTHGRGFRFTYDMLREATKRLGRKIAGLPEGVEVVAVHSVSENLVAVAADSGRLLVFPAVQVPVLAGPGQGVRLIRLEQDGRVAAVEPVAAEDALRIEPKKGKDKIIRVNQIPVANRATKGKRVCPTIRNMRREQGMDGEGQ